MNATRTRRWKALPLSGLMAAGLLSAGPAAADPETRFAQAINALRGSCGALAHDPIVQRAAEISGRSTEDYLNHNARFVPVNDPLAVLADLGSPAGKAIALQGYGRDDATALKGALLQGHTAIPDCSYHWVGASVLRNPEDGYTVAVAVLAGP